VSDLESDVAAARDDAAQQVRQMRSAQEASAAELHKLRLEHKGSVDRMLQEQVEETRSLTASFQQVEAPPAVQGSRCRHADTSIVIS